MGAGAGAGAVAGAGVGAGAVVKSGAVAVVDGEAAGLCADPLAGVEDWLDRAALRLELRVREDALLKRAAFIREENGRWAQKSKRAAPAGSRMPCKKFRRKCHRDFLLDEMVWLAKEFQKERRWKMSQSKKFAHIVKKSNLDVESRVKLRRQEEEKNLRKVARGISQEVMTWWSKVERLVMYKRRAGVEAVRKQELDHQLDFLVSQTERYVNVLARSIQGGPRADALPSGDAVGPPTPQPESTQPNPQRGEGPGVTWADGQGEAGGAGAAAEAAGNRGTDVFAEVPGDSDYEPSEEAADDERTLAEEESLAAAEGNPGQADELANLRKEMELPIEKIVQRYEAQGTAVGGEIGEPAAPGPASLSAPATQSVEEAMDLLFAEDSEDSDFEPSCSGSADDEATMAAEEEREAREGRLDKTEELAALERDNEAPPSGGLPPENDTGTEKGRSGGAGPSGQKCEGSRMDDYFKDEPDDSEFQPSEDDGMDLDDETTMAAEEQAEAAEGLTRDPAQEIAALRAAMEEPIEVLRARFQERSLQSPSPSTSSGQSPPRPTGPGGSGEPQPGPPVLGGGGGPALPSPKPVLPGVADLEKRMDEIFADDSGDSDFDPSVEGSDGEDDEATLAAEEAKEVLEGQARQVQELARLQEEMEVPLGEVHRRYSSEELRDEKPGVKVEFPVAEATPTYAEQQEPFLLKHSLREYQVKGLEWMTTLAQKGLNGILADEMGLGKTIQTIALLARWAADKGQWGPHLIVVPTSVMLNWEMEFKKWCPGFKILTYYGSARERQAKRQGWSKPNSFHVCITSYTLILADAKMFRRKQWNFLILDEAHLIKNWQSLKWQTLLNFHSQHRVLLTGTPLQNSLMELWSLMHFLMPTVFDSHDEFKEWFSNPMTGMVEGQEGVDQRVIRRLHGILRPFILRRLKSQVERQMPKKYEHIVTCRLSRRQRQLYDDYISSSDAQAALTGGNYFSVFGVLMALRKVCNHPDLFEGRAITSPFTSETICLDVPSLAVDALADSDASGVDLGLLNFDLVAQEGLPSAKASCLGDAGATTSSVQALEEVAAKTSAMSHSASVEARALHRVLRRVPPAAPGVFSHMRSSLDHHRAWALNRARAKAYVNDLRCARRPVYGADLRRLLLLDDPVRDAHTIAADPRRRWSTTALLGAAVKTHEQRLEGLLDVIRHCLVALPRARASSPKLWCLHPDPCLEARRQRLPHCVHPLLTDPAARSWPELICHKMYFPNRWLVQYDCGKLQELAVLLRRLKKGGHRVLIFTQMSKMLDVLEVFLNLYSYTYMRLDGTTKPDQRQILMTKFNSDDKTFCFILSTRSGGVGINLTGADTVIFYDSDWNPAMDAQAQDRCHRIGQTRDVHVYRLVTENTIESNILLKSNQKRHLDHLAIQSGKFGNLEAGGGEDRPAAGAVQQAEVAGIENALTALGGTPLKARLTSNDVKSALKSAEDADDRRAAAAAALEAEEEAAEFGDGDVGDGDGGEGDVKAGNTGPGKRTQPPVTGAEDFEQREQKARVPTVEELQHLLYPVECYAVALYEELYPATPEERGERSAPLPQREAWSLHDVEERRGMLDAGFNPDELLFCNTFDRETARRVYLSSVRAAQGPRPRFTLLAK